MSSHDVNDHIVPIYGRAGRAPWHTSLYLIAEDGAEDSFIVSPIHDDAGDLVSIRVETFSIEDEEVRATSQIWSAAAFLGFCRRTFLMLEGDGVSETDDEAGDDFDDVDDDDVGDDEADEDLDDDEDDDVDADDDEDEAGE